MTGRTQLSVDLIARVGGFEAGMKRASTAANQLGGRLRSVAGVAGTAAAGIFTAYAATSAAFVKRSIDRMDELGEAAEKIGIPVETLSSFEYAARFGGVAFDKLEGGLGRLIKAQVEVSRGSERITEIFDALRVDAIDPLTGALRPTEDVLLELADVFQKLPEGPQKAALAVEIFGKSGRDLIPFLNKGSEGIRELTDESDELGVTVTSVGAKLGGEFNDRLDQLKGAAQGAGQSVAERLLPGLVAVNGPLDQFVELLKDPGVQDGFANIISGALTAVGALARFAAETANVVQFVAEEVAFQATGQATSDDIVRLEKQRNQLRARLEKNGDSILTTPLGFSPEKRAELEQELKGVTTLIDDYYKNVEARAKAAADRAKAAGAPVAVNVSGEVNISGLFRPTSGAGGGSGRGTAGESEREQARAQKELQERLDATRDAASEFNSQLVAYRDEVSGPLAQAQTDWAVREQQLQELAARGEISQEQLAEALGYTAELRQRDIDAINSQLTPAQEVIASLEEELRLLGLSNKEREIANALRYAGAEATEEEKKAIADLIRLRQEEQKAIANAEELRRGFEDTFASIIDGSKSAKDAFADLGNYITSLIARRLGESLVDSLLGPPGTSLGSNGAGGLGGFLSSALGSLFGGPRASGGFVAPGKMYEVAERGPELLTVGGRQYLLPTATGGMVTANPRLGGGGTVNQNITVVGQITSRTATHLATETSRAQRRAAARFGA
jgi:hypothetical protein